MNSQGGGDLIDEIAAHLSAILQIVTSTDSSAPDAFPQMRSLSTEARRLLRQLVEFDELSAGESGSGALSTPMWAIVDKSEPSETVDGDQPGPDHCLPTPAPPPPFKGGENTPSESIMSAPDLGPGNPPRSTSGVLEQQAIMSVVPAVAFPRAGQTTKKSVHLPNARAGIPYTEPLPIPDLVGAHLVDAGDMGLLFDSTTLTFSGIPVDPGDFTMRLSGEIDGRPCDLSVHLAVIPDPKSLWVSIPSDMSAAFWKPDEDSQEVAGELFCIAASKRGRSHAQDGGCRDDDFGLAVTPDGWHIAAVADGAGSASFSRRGSRVAVETVLEHLPALLSQHLSPFVTDWAAESRVGIAGSDARIKLALYATLATAAFEAAKAVEREAERYQKPASDFSTTLIVTIVKRISLGWFVAGFGVGDGGAAVFDVDSCALVPLTLPDSGEFAGQTRFLHRSEFKGGYTEVAKRLFYAIPERFTLVALMTDGITDPLFPTEVALADPEVWRSFWLDDISASVVLAKDNLDARLQLLSWLDFWSPGNHDDRTIAILLP